MTLSPDGKWLWNGTEWIPAPPKSDPYVVEQAKETITQVAEQYGLKTDNLYRESSNFDLNQDGVLQKSEIQQAAISMKQSPTMRVSSQPPRQSPMVYRNIDHFFHRLVNNKGKTFYAPLITVGLVFLLMFTPFLIFEHDELTNSEEDEACEFIYQSFQSASNNEESVESDDLECPMNGYTSSIYSIETISNFEIDDLDEDSDWFQCDNGEEIPSSYVNDGMEDCSDGSDETNSSANNEEDMFVIAMLMLFASPFIYLLFALIAVFSVWLKKYPIVIGILQLLFVVFFMIISSGGSMGDDSFELSVHGNFAGLGIYLVGFASIGYFIPK